MRYFKQCQKKITRKLTLTIITFAVLMMTGAADAMMVVIANPSLSINQLSKDQLTSLYLGKPISLGVNVTPYNQPDNTLVFQAFYQQIVGWNADQLSSYWTSQVFSGGGEEPTSVSNDQAAINLVEQNPTAIAYVNSDSLRNVGRRLKIIYGDYKIPVHHYHPRVHRRKAPAPQLYSSNSSNGYMTALSTDPASDYSSNTVGPETNPDVDLAQQLTAINNSNQAGENIWNLIAAHMSLQNQSNNPEVRHWILWFQQHPRTLKTMIDNATPYIYYIYHQTQRRHMPAEFALLPMIESGYNPRAYSSAGAGGLWQLMPGTASSYGMAIDWWYDSRRDILTATNAGLNYLVYLHHKTGKWFLAAAAYNVGPGALDAAMHRNKRAGRATDFWDLHLPKQTENYVPKLLAISAIIANPGQYGVHLPYVPDHPSFASVTLTSQMDLKEISQFSNVSIPIIKALNPGLQRWATAPSGTFTLLLPVMSVNTFKVNLQKMIGKTHMSWAYHRVGAGESLSAIASHHQISLPQLERVNNLHSAHVVAGQGLIVPVQRNQVYTKLAGTSGEVKGLQNEQGKILSQALKRAVDSQQKALPAEVTGEPIKRSDNLKSLLGKLYGTSTK